MAQDRTAPLLVSRRPLTGWSIVLWSTVAVCTASSFMFTLEGGGLEGWHAVVRTSAKTSIALFLLAFIASSARVFWRGPFTKWLLANRRYVGLSFAASHAVHLAAILTIVAFEPGFHSSPTTVVFGSLGYVILAAMAATSSDAAVAWLGGRAWKALHKTGMYYLWFIFLVSYLPRLLTQSPWYALFVVPLLAGIGLRFAAWQRQRRKA
ncbi:MAG: hypothetical protein ABI629_12670 [bacterium]